MRPRSDDGPASSALSTSSQLPFNASLSNGSMGTCPVGGQWYACPIQSPTFFGCCNSNACNGIGCPNTDLRAAGMGTAAGPNQGDNDGSYWPNVKCSIGQWWTCSNQTPSFQGCCDNNPCNGDGSGCPAGHLHPAEFLNGTTIATTVSVPISTTLALSSTLTAPTPSSTGSLAQVPSASPSATTKSTLQLNSSQGSSLVSNPTPLNPDSTVTITRFSTLHSTVTTYAQTSSPSPESILETSSNVPISQSTSTSTPPSLSSTSPTTNPTTLLTISTSPSIISSSSTFSSINPTTLLTISASPSSTLSSSSASLTQTQLATPTASGLTNALSSTPRDPNRKAKIIGGAIGGVLLLLLILLAAWYSRRRYRKMADERRARLSAQQSVAEGEFAVSYSNLPVSKDPPQLTTEPPYPISPLANHLYPPEESSPGSVSQLHDPFPPHLGHFLSQPAQDEDHDADVSSTAGMHGGDDPPSLWNRNMERPPRP